MSNLIYLLENYTLSTLLVLIVFLFLAVKEICGAVVWVKDKLEAYRKKKNATEDEKDTVEERLKTLEKHDNWQYNALLDVNRILQGISKTLTEMQQKQKMQLLLQQEAHCIVSHKKF